MRNPLEYIFPNFLERNLKQRKIAQKIYENFILLHLKQYPLVKPTKDTVENILHINTAIGKGGAAKVVYDFLNKNYLKLGFNSSTIAGSVFIKNPTNTKHLSYDNIKLHKLLHRYSKETGLLDFFNLNSFNIPEIPEFKKADIVHLHNLHGSYFSPFLLPLLTSLKPTVWTLHDEQSFTGHCSYSFDCAKWQEGCGNCSDLNYYPKIKTDTTAMLIKLKEKIYNFSDFSVVCPSKWLANRAKNSILKGKNIEVIYNGINTDIFKPMDKIEARKKLGLPLDKKILMFSASGSIKNPQKGGIYIKNAYEKLKLNKDILFLNIGGNNKSQKENWLDTPYIQDESVLAMYYNAADIFIYPSLVEAFGLVIAESMACETPVVAFNNSAIPELIDHMDNGYLANNKDLDDFIKGINSLLEDNNFRQNAGLNGRKKVLANFTLDKMVQNYLELYKKSVAERLKA